MTDAPEFYCPCGHHTTAHDQDDECIERDCGCLRDDSGWAKTRPDRREVKQVKKLEDDWEMVQRALNLMLVGDGGVIPEVENALVALLRLREARRWETEYAALEEQVERFLAENNQLREVIEGVRMRLREALDLQSWTSVALAADALSNPTATTEATDA